MDDKKTLPITIKTEPNTSTPKRTLSPSTFAQLTAKCVSNTRLASFKPPRDLLLTGTTNSSYTANTKSTKRTYTPNVNVTRRKGISETVQNSSSSDPNQKNKEKEKNKKLPVTYKKKSTNVVQTQGVFSEGLAPGKVKAFSSGHEKSYNEKQVLDKPKLNLNRKICKKEEDSKLKSILKDDFVDDPNVVPDTSLLPNCLPMMCNVKKSENPDDLEKTFETLQVKPEKLSNVNIKDMKSEKDDLNSVFEGDKGPKMFLFEFPSPVQQTDDFGEKKKGSKGQPTETDKQNVKSEGLSSLGEGFLGYLRIHENGKAYLVCGKTLIPLSVTRHSTRQEIMSTGVDPETSKGEVISLGTVDASFTCSANFFQDVS